MVPQRAIAFSIAALTTMQLVVALTFALLPPSPSLAVRGAAELDLEYYARDLFGGNRREGNVETSRGPPMPPPRNIEEPLRSMLLTEDASCIPKNVLVTMLARSKASSLETRFDMERLVQDRFVDVRSKSAKAFYARAPYAAETLSDQYYFDLSAYALWRTAGDLLSNPVDRDAFVRQVGRDLYQRMLSDKMMIAAPFNELSRFKISATTVGWRSMLDVFVTHGFIKSYRLTGAAESNSDEPDSNVFDELDDEALNNGATVDCLLSIIEPATLGAALQITGEQSRFAPDYIGPTCAALLEGYGLKCTWETYFVDNEYRPNPKDYFPNEQLIQFTILKSIA
ncbi:hypothetical protein MPSEU_000218700 [Mayamaea pseudoterrestris]|nr:hypothetical protein MPSEU_000218700 [Mayamaea pseudoterrestris]